MRLSRADVVPVLTIIVGGAIGLLLTVRPLLLRSASVDVPAPGSTEYNLALGSRRSESVREFLAGFGISPDRLNTTSFGEERPPIDRSAEAARAQNRLVVDRPALSPDGRWIAYVSDETGHREVYVTSFPDMTSGRWQVSTDGGVKPLWTADGRLFFVDRNGGRVVVQLEARRP